MENKHTYTEYKLENGETIKCTVAFAFLLKLRAQNKRIYDKLNHAMINGLNEIVDAACVLYGAYLCACCAGENGGIENAMPEADFMDALGSDIMGVVDACTAMISQKKN